MYSWRSGAIAVLRLWRRVLMVTVPLMLLPFLLSSDSNESKCAYVVFVIGLYWIAEPIPLGATSLLPIVLLPLLGVLSTERTCDLYMNETNIMFVGTLIVAIAIEHSHLHERMALKTLCLLGTGIKRLVLGLMLISMFLAIWINNVAITAMMMPVVDSLSKELFESDKPTLEDDNERAALSDQSVRITASTLPQLSPKESEGQPETSLRVRDRFMDPEEAQKKRLRVLLYLSVIYGANTGAITTITSAASNIVFKFVVEDVYQGRAPVDYASWLFFALPIALASTVVIYISMILLLVSRRADVAGGGGGDTSTLAVIQKNYDSLGPIRFHEVAVLTLSSLLIFLWVFRDPMFAKGWGTYFGDMKPKDATAVMTVVVLFFVIPARPSDPARSPGLLTWDIVQAKLQWSVILLIGGGFALAEGTRVSGLSHWVGQKLAGLQHLSPGVLMITLSVICSFISEVISNAGTVTILLPVFAALAEDSKMNPLLLMIPATIASNFAFLLPVGTPANAIVYEHAKLKVADMVGPGFIVKSITLLVTAASTYIFGGLIFDMFSYPDWVAGNSTDPALIGH
ncbi:Na(+)/citrate cotransporter-like isoform X3 [Ornithodoros turicata]|uniref:Na(+)/citrate cotransporter-like isoform X3 n=1 Tax=Ornithodoros turicata TaxID=34597 RepID=UPI003138E69B